MGTPLRKATNIAALALLSLPLLGMGNCGVKKVRQLPPEQVLPLQTATLEELLDRIDQQADAVWSVYAVTELVPSTGSAYSGVIEQYHDVRAFLLARRGGLARQGGQSSPPSSKEAKRADAAEPLSEAGGRQIRLIGQAPVVRKTVFDMTADSESFRIYLPTKSKFIVGANELRRQGKSPIENLRPQHLFDAIFPSRARALPQLAHFFFEENEFGGRRYYGISETARFPVHCVSEEGIVPCHSFRLYRKWWFDRTNLALVRFQRFGLEGELLSDVHYADWREVGGVLYPRQIELRRPQEDYRLRLVIKELTLNQPLAPEKFQLERPAGVELVELKEKDPLARSEESEP